MVDERTTSLSIVQRLLLRVLQWCSFELDRLGPIEPFLGCSLGRTSCLDNCYFVGGWKVTQDRRLWMNGNRSGDYTFCLKDECGSVIQTVDDGAIRGWQEALARKCLFNDAGSMQVLMLSGWLGALAGGRRKERGKRRHGVSMHSHPGLPLCISQSFSHSHSYSPSPLHTTTTLLICPCRSLA